MSTTHWKTALKQRWAGLQPRERLGLQWALALLALYLIWALALASPLRMWRDSASERALLETQLQRMLAWRAQAQALKAQTDAPAGPWRQGLTEGLQALGDAELSWSGNTATVRLKGCPPAALGPWLATLGPQWRLQVSRASLRLDEQGLWQGELTVQGP